MKKTYNSPRMLQTMSVSLEDRLLFGSIVDFIYPAENRPEAVLDLQTGTVTPKKSSPIQVLTLKNISFDPGETEPILEAYLTILPVDMTNNSVCVKVFDDNQNAYSVVLTGKNYVAGTIYNISKEATKDLTHSGLPVVYINTSGHVGITSKDVYVENTLFSVLQTDVMKEFCNPVNIKGRGNTTWGMPKKPYALKFDKKKSLLGLPEDKSWVLLANYYDPSLIRNDLAFYFGNELSALDWSPHFTIVDLVLNGQYQGIYQLGEKVKVSKGRVNVGDTGFLLEVDERAKSESDARYFQPVHTRSPMNIKEPEVEYNDENYNFIRDYISEVETVLYSESFTDPVQGWRKYLDMDSFVDWYIIMETSNNADKYNNPEEFRLKDCDCGWYPRLFQNPVFVARVKERFNAYYARKQDIMDFIDARETMLAPKVVEDNRLWGTITSASASSDQVVAAYHGKITYLKNWLSTRLDWLYTHINAL